MPAAPPTDFGLLLEAIAKGSDQDCPGSVGPRGPLRGAVAAINLSDHSRLEGLAAWDRAMDWMADLKAQDPQPARDTTDPRAIALELRLHTKMEVRDLKALRRAFMWRNHPDRSHGLSAELASRRAATANMLIDAMLLRAKADPDSSE